MTSATPSLGADMIFHPIVIVTCMKSSVDLFMFQCRGLSFNNKHKADAQLQQC